VNAQLWQLLAPVVFGAGAGGAVGLVAGVYSSVMRMEIGKGLSWLALETVLDQAEAGLAGGAVCAIVGWVLARRATEPLSRKRSQESSRPGPWVAMGLVGLLGAGWVQEVLWSAPDGLMGRLVFFLLPVATVVAALAVVLVSGWIIRAIARGDSRWRRLVAAGVLVVVAVLGLGGLGAAHRWASRDRQNVLLVVVDCLRADRLGTYGYDGATSPVLDRLAGASLLFEQAHSTAAWTKPAIVSVLTGLYPARHGSVDPFDVLPRVDATLPELLGNAGYQTVFLNGGNTFVSHEFGFDAVFGDYELLDMGDAREVVDAFRARAAALRTGPFFAYLHLMDVHLPYGTAPHAMRISQSTALREELQPGRINVGTVRALSEKGELSAIDRELVGQLYDAQVRFVDSQLARLLAVLGEAGLADSTTVIVTADHGEELWEHGNFEHGHTLYNEITQVPLLIFGAGVPAEYRGERRAEPVSLVDLAPTILGLAGVAPRERSTDGLGGLDLLVASRREMARRGGVFLSGTLYGSEKFAFLTAAGKAIVTSGLSAKKFSLVGPRSFEQREWYAAADTTETDNRTADAPSSMWQNLGEYRETEGARVEETDPSAAAREKLEALGYLQ